MSRLRQAITAPNPEAHLLATGQIFVLNRTWFRGREDWGWIGIHVSRSRDREHKCREFGLNPDRLVYGCMVAVANLSIIIHVNEIQGLVSQCRDRWGWLSTHQNVTGPYCWVFNFVNPLETPVAMRGNRGIWEIDFRNLGRVRREAAAWRQAHDGGMLVPESVEV